jgi:hypothetical protein
LRVEENEPDLKGAQDVAKVSLFEQQRAHVVRQGEIEKALWIALFQITR